MAIFDAHPLAKRRESSTADYLRDRLGGIMRLVPGVTEAHIRFSMFERMLDDGVADAAEIFHTLGVKVDLWTLDARRRGGRSGSLVLSPRESTSSQRTRPAPSRRWAA